MLRYHRISVVVVVSAAWFWGGIARAGFINGGFETGDFSGWQTLGATSVQTAVFGITPAEGIYQALLENHTPGFAGTSSDQIESFLGLASGTLSGLGNGDVIQGTAIAQSFTGNAGAVLSFRWNFLTNEDTPSTGNNDFAFISVSPVKTSTLASTLDTFVSSPIPEFTAVTGYQTFTYTIPTSGTYTLGLGVVDVGDEFTNSGLLVDNVSLTTAVPEPSTLLLTVIGACGLLGYAGLRRRRTDARTGSPSDRKR